MLPYASSRLQHCFQTGGIGGVRGGEAVELENFWQLNVQLKKKKKSASKCEVSLYASHSFSSLPVHWILNLQGP